MAARVAITVAIAALTFAACGGGSAGKHYDLSATKACLQSDGVDTKADTNPFATGSEGNLAADFNDFDVFLAFGTDEDEAEEMKKGIDAVGSGFGAQGASAEQRGNVMYYANSESLPTDAREQVEDCLREADAASAAPPASTSTAAADADDAPPAQLARFTRQARGVLRSIPPEALHTFSPEGGAAYGELEELSRDGLTNGELATVQKDLDDLDRELAYYQEHKGTYSEDE